MKIRIAKLRNREFHMQISINIGQCLELRQAFFLRIYKFQI
jgi:hypothetical protein